LDLDEVGAIKYEIIPISQDVAMVFTPYLDAGITNEDTNWDDKFWDTYQHSHKEDTGYILSKTMKTDFHVCTGMLNQLFVEDNKIDIQPSVEAHDTYVALNYTIKVGKGKKVSLVKFGGYTVSLNHKKKDLVTASKAVLKQASESGFDALLDIQKRAWAKVWEMADITIDGDVKAQQGIRFNIFQLNQTYLGKNPRLNIGPKGFTGEKYGYPMVTMNGEECHNEWEITFEEIHRNGAMTFAIYNYHRYTGDYSYIPEKGLEVMIGIARFWHQRATFSNYKNKYVILGVTGPNEYENNVNNNWYTNYLAKWSIEYCIQNVNKVKVAYASDYKRIIERTNLDEDERWIFRQRINYGCRFRSCSKANKPKMELGSNFKISIYQTSRCFTGVLYV